MQEAPSRFHFAPPLLAVCLVLGLSANAFAYNLRSDWDDTASSFNHVLGDPLTLTWGIVDDGTSITGSEGTSPSDLIVFLDTEIGPSTTWLPLFEQSYNRWGELSGLTFMHETNDTGHAINSSAFPEGSLGIRPDMRIGGHSIDGQSGSNTLAYNYFPDHGDMVIDTDNENFYDGTSNNWRALRNTLMHEIGHGIGIRHVVSDTSRFLMEPSISTSFDGPQLDDILAAQRHYGDVWEKNGGNDILANSLSLNDRFVGNTASIGTDADNTDVGANDIDFVSIDDNSDTDYFSFSVTEPSLLNVLLTPKGPTYTEAIQDDPPATQVSFDTSAQSDLSLRIYDASGTPMTGVINSSGLGGAESLDDLILPAAGTYHVRVTGSANTVQLYQLDVTTSLDFLSGDVNLDGMISTGSGNLFDDDVAAFIAGWKTVLPEDDDLTAWGKGDLNLDRVSDLLDALILHKALADAGFANFGLFDQLNVPEPTTAMLSLTALFGFLGLGRRNRG